jgi:hypothetical protein
VVVFTVTVDAPTVLIETGSPATDPLTFSWNLFVVPEFPIETKAPSAVTLGARNQQEIVKGSAVTGGDVASI